jgi:hypothetical protein
MAYPSSINCNSPVEAICDTACGLPVEKLASEASPQTDEWSFRGAAKREPGTHNHEPGI